MKIVLSTLLLITTISYAQFPSYSGPYATEIISYNTMSCPVDNSGVLFRKLNPAMATFGPKADATSIYYGASFHFVGITQFGDTLGAAGLGDLFPGPVSSTNQYLDSIYIQKYHTNVWRVTAGEIANHIAEYNLNGIVNVPAYNIVNWPAHGDISLGIAANLAPFEDLNNNGVYEPQFGDYPKIKGCDAIYVILNDEAYVHDNSSEGNLGIEVHAMVYQYLDGSVLDSTTFADIRVINRSTTNYPFFQFGLWNDVESGCHIDDYFGSDSLRSLGYGYNGTLNDGTCSNWNFVNTPSVSGMKLLNSQAHCIMYQPAIHGPTFSTTRTAKGNLKYMNGYNIYGTHLRFGGNGYDNLPPNAYETNFHYSGDPNLPPSWSMLDSDSLGTPQQANDVNFILSQAAFSLNANDEHTLSCAIMYSIAGNAFQGVSTLKNTAELVQQMFDNGLGACTDPSMGLNALNDFPTFELYPNPARDQILLKGQALGPCDPIFFDSQGLILNLHVNTQDAEISVDLSELEPGMYFVSLCGSVKQFIKL